MVSGATWILWVHLLAAAAWLGGAAMVLVAILPVLGRDAASGTIRRAHFLTSRAMEVLFLTGILNLVILAVVEHASVSSGFYRVVGVKAVLLVIMAGIQVWMGF